jgi:hypothetical protein
MKAQITLVFLLLSILCMGQNFEGTIKWTMSNEMTDPKAKAQMEAAQKQMNDPAMQAQMKQMQEKMNDPQFKAVMDQNPQLKAQMESMMKMQGGGAGSMMPTGFTIKIKNGNTLTIMEGGMVAGNETLYLKDKNQTYILNKPNKTYSVVPQGSNAPGKSPQGEVKVTKTTETQKILNYTCTKTIVKITDKGKSIDQIFWTTNEIKDFDLKSLSNQKMGNGQSMYYENLEGVPLKMEMIMPQAKIVMQVTEIKKETLASTVFEIPTGFTETKMPGQ